MGNGEEGKGIKIIEVILLFFGSFAMFAFALVEAISSFSLNQQVWFFIIIFLALVVLIITLLLLFKRSKQKGAFFILDW